MNDPTTGVQQLANRLRKRQKHLGKWARRTGNHAYRLYDRDISDHPLTVERYGDYIVAWAFQRTRDDSDEQRSEWLRLVQQAAMEGLNLSEDRFILKDRYRQAGRQEDAEGPGQYGRQNHLERTLLVEEEGLHFKVNLTDYLDTGLFVDHRALRRRVRHESDGKRVLNLFAYTGSFTCAAALGGASATTTVDLSNTYCDWAGTHLKLNGFHEGDAHKIIRADCLEWLRHAARESKRYDIIVCDPPTFSNSKAMRGSWSVHKDHGWLLSLCRELLTPTGTCYFSTNARKFTFDDGLSHRLQAREITSKTLDEDVASRPPHRCWSFDGG